MKIAVIDDERPARKMLIRRVKEVRPDCEITEAESGADALKMFNEADSFDLIFVDMDLGDMEGTTLAATAKRLFPGAKIVFATAYSLLCLLFFCCCRFRFFLLLLHFSRGITFSFPNAFFHNMVHPLRTERF